MCCNNDKKQKTQNLNYEISKRAGVKCKEEMTVDELFQISDNHLHLFLQSRFPSI